MFFSMCVSFSSLPISSYIYTYIPDFFCLCNLFLHLLSQILRKKQNTHSIQPTDFSSWLSRAELESERERERGSVGFNLPFLSRPLSHSLSLSRLAITNHDNRWEPPPGSAWECSGIIASGTPSTITQRRHGQREVGWKTGETRQ